MTISIKGDAIHPTEPSQKHRSCRALQNDPFLDLRKAWVVRRLSPDCSRVELSTLPKGRDERKLLEAMGRETINVHLGSRQAMAKVKRDFNKRPNGWLHDAAKTMVQATTRDWQEWCREGFAP